MGVECLFVHRKSQLFLPAYVDEIRMVGKERKIGTSVDNSANINLSGRTDPNC